MTTNLGIMVHVRGIATNTMLKSLRVCPFEIGKYPWETPGNVFGVSREGGGKREEAFGLLVCKEAFGMHYFIEFQIVEYTIAP